MTVAAPASGSHEAAGEPEVHPAVAAALRALDEAGVDWCLLRGEDELASPADVDLLVSPGHLPRAQQTLARLGFARLRAFGYGPHRFLVAYDEEGDRWLKLDLVTELVYGPHWQFPLAPAEACLARRHRRDGLSLLSPDDAFWTLLLHCLLDRAEVQPRHAEQLVRLAASARSDGPLARLVGDVLPAGWSAESILAAARASDWLALASLAPELPGRWARRRPLAVWPRLLANASRHRARKIGRLLARRGLRVAVLGPDGSGKSTLVAGLLRSFFLPARSLYGGFHPVEGRRPRIHRLGLPGRILDLWWKFLLAAWHRARGRLVVFDRYPYDALLPPEGPLRLGDRIRRLVVRAAPTPHLVVLLDVPAEVAAARKGGQDVAALDDQRRRYLALRDRVRHVAVVDAAQDAEAVRRAATAAIWRRYGSARER